MVDVDNVELPFPLSSLFFSLPSSFSALLLSIIALVAARTLEISRGRQRERRRQRNRDKRREREREEGIPLLLAQLENNYRVTRATRESDGHYHISVEQSPGMLTVIAGKTPIRRAAARRWEERSAHTDAHNYSIGLLFTARDA